MIAIAVAVGALSLPAEAVPLGSAFTYQGHLTEAGQPALGLYDIQVCLFDSATTPIPLSCAADFDDVPVEDGLFALSLDFGAESFTGDERFLELRVRAGSRSGGYAILAPRQSIRPSPEALRANAADSVPWSGLTGVPGGFADGIDDVGVTAVTGGAGLTGGTISTSGTLAVDTGVIQRRVVGSCTVGQMIRQINADGSVICEADSSGSGTVTSVASGPGLTGGPIATSGTLAVDFAAVQARISGTCPLGYYLRGIAGDGAPVCRELPGAISISTVDIGPSIGQRWPSLRIGANGLPSISYYDADTGEIKVATCANPSCSAVASIAVVEFTGSLLDVSTSLAIGADGFPVMVYNTIADDELRIAKCVDPACLVTPVITAIEPAGVFGSSIAIGDDGFPVISFFRPPGSLAVAKCSDQSCSATRTVTVVDAPSNVVGTYTSIAIGTDGRPVISYQDASAGDLKAAKCANPNCTGSATVTVVDSSANFLGVLTSIAVGMDGRPIIAHLDVDTWTLRVAHCANAACTGASTVTAVDTTGNQVGHSPSIAIGSDGRSCGDCQQGHDEEHAARHRRPFDLDEECEAVDVGQGQISTGQDWVEIDRRRPKCRQRGQQVLRQRFRCSAHVRSKAGRLDSVSRAMRISASR